VIETAPILMKVEFIRIAYNVEKVVAAITGSGLPTYFAERLKEGR
jgi:hypothetical protein